MVTSPLTVRISANVSAPDTISVCAEAMRQSPAKATTTASTRRLAHCVKREALTIVWPDKRYAQVFPPPARNVITRWGGGQRTPVASRSPPLVKEARCI